MTLLCHFIYFLAFYGSSTALCDPHGRLRHRGTMCSNPSVLMPNLASYDPHGKEEQRMTMGHPPSMPLMILVLHDLCKRQSQEGLAYPMPLLSCWTRAQLICARRKRKVAKLPNSIWLCYWVFHSMGQQK